jgi:formate/nitrite transporter FocA (FNT family)
MPIAAFVALGLEHSVANMFLLPLGMVLGAPVTVCDAAANLVPVTLGNAVGAALFIGGIQRVAVFGPSGAMRPPAP